MENERNASSSSSSAVAILTLIGSKRRHLAGRLAQGSRPLAACPEPGLFSPWPCLGPLACNGPFTLERMEPL
eukprot:11196650-Lingulodinium_polyedra.AAC.1